MMHNFSSKTISILKSAGWQEGRKIDVSAYIDLFERKGYTVFPVARAFLEQFGGLVLRQTKPDPPKSWFELICEVLWPQAKFPDPFLDLRVEQTLSHFAGWEPEDLMEKLNISMCPIGHDSDAIIYGMDAQGKVYGSYWPTYFFIADSGEHAIERYCTSSFPYQVIYEDSNES